MENIRFFIGSGNSGKRRAVELALVDYEIFSKASIHSRRVDSGVDDQPSSMEETLLGAITRARQAHNIGCTQFPGDRNYGIGIEDGLMYIPHSGNDHRASFNCCACSIYDGNKQYIGLGPAYEYPPEVLDFVFRDGMDITQAFNAAVLCNNPRIGEDEGVVAVLSRGAIERPWYNAQAVRMALIGLINRMV